MLFFAVFSLGGPARAEVLRVELARAAASAELSGQALSIGGVKAASGRATLTAAGGVLLVDGARLAPVASIAADGPLRLGERALRGTLLARADGDRVTLVDELELEDYVAAVTGSEMPPSWPAEALKAQAVAARTYALRQKLAAGVDAPVHVEATVLDQVYKGVSAETPATLEAARATAGEVLTSGAEPIEAYFHSACGGRTEAAADAFGHSRPYLVSVACGADADAPRARWEVQVPLAELASRLGAPGLRGLAVVERTATGRARRLALTLAGGHERSVTANDFRRLVGYDRVPSLDFTVAVKRGEASLRGKGSGHGVGMCQWGARGLAARGESYRAILARYYPGTEIRRMY